MRNFVQEGHSLDFIALAAVSAGVPVLMGNTLCVPATDADVGETFAGWLEGVYEDVAAEGAANGQAWTPGETLYWDNVHGRFTVTAAEGTKAAIAVLPKASADVTGTVRLVLTL